jgi:hypothetical protein
MGLPGGLASAVKKAGSAAKPAIATDNQGAAFLLGGLTVITGVIAALGISGGMVGRMARNEELATAFAFGLTVLAVIVGGLAAWVYKPPSQSTQQSRALWLGFLLLAGAGLAATLAAVSVWGDRTQPRLAATIAKSNGGPILRITVKDSSLHAGDRITVLVKPLLRELQQSSGGYLYSTGLALFRTSIGPDVDGNVNSTFKVPVVPGEYGAIVVSAATQGNETDNCYQTDSDKACVTLRTVGAERPQLRAIWRRTVANGRVIAVGLTADDIPQRTISLRVWGAVNGRWHRHRLLAEWLLAPDENGDFHYSEVVPVPADIHRICAVASTIERGLKCPPPRTLPVSRSAPFRARLIQDAYLGTVWLAVRRPGIGR